MHALADFVTEHGERGLRALGGRARPRAGSPSRTRARRPRARTGPRPARGRAPLTPRSSCPAEALVDGPTALRAWRDSDSRRSWRPARTPRSSAGPACPSATAKRTRAPTCTRATTRSTPSQRPLRHRRRRRPRRLLGSISLMRFAWEHRRGEVGYWPAPAGARSRPRHAGGAPDLRLGVSRARPGAHRLVRRHRKPSSQRVAERAGFTREAVLRSYMEGKEGRLDMVAFRRLAGPD